MQLLNHTVLAILGIASDARLELARMERSIVVHISHT